LVPLKKTKSGRAHAIALSSESARYSNETVTGPAPFGRTRQVSGSVLSQRSCAPRAVASKPDTQWAKLLTSYAPGVHTGSDSSTGALDAASKVIATCSDRCRAVLALNVTS
jgi:hypothetical protein